MVNKKILIVKKALHIDIIKTQYINTEVYMDK